MDNPIIEDPINLVTSVSNTGLIIAPKINSSGNYLYQWYYSPQTGIVNPNTFIAISSGLAVNSGTGINLVLDIQNSNTNNHLYWYKLNITDMDTNLEYSTEPMQLGILSNNLNITGIPLYVYANNGKANLQVLPSGANYTYVWKKQTITHDEELDLKKYVEVSSGISNILSLSGLGISDNYSIYNVTVISGSDSWTSPPITLIYDPSITLIQNNIKNFNLPDNGSHQLYVVAQSSNGILSYKWQKSTKGGAFEDIPGATKNLLNLSGLGINDIGDKYRAVVSSNIAKTNFKYTPEAQVLNNNYASSSIVIQYTANDWQDLVYITNAGIELILEAYSEHGSTVEWRWLKSTDKISWTDINVVGVMWDTPASLYIPFTKFENKQEYYRVQLTEFDSNAYTLSNIVTVDYNPTTYVIANPTNLNTTNGSGNLSCQFFQNLTGVYDYAWHRFPISGTDIMEKSTMPYSITPNADGSHGFYTSVLSLTGLSVVNNDGDRYAFIGKTKDTQNVALISKQAYVTVPNTLTIATGLPDLIRIPVGQSGSLEVSVTTSIPGGTVNYQWSSSTNSGLSFSNIANATGNKLNIPTTASGDNNKYYRVTANDSINTIILK